MLRRDVVLGGVYTAKVSNVVVNVRLDTVNRFGGWNATNLATGRAVRIKSAGKLRSIVSTPDSRAKMAVTEPIVNKPKGKTKRYSTQTRKALVANGQSPDRPSATTIVVPEDVRAALDTAMMYLGDYIYNGAESGAKDEVDGIIGTLSDFLASTK